MRASSKNQYTFLSLFTSDAGGSRASGDFEGMTDHSLSSARDFYFSLLGISVVLFLG
jgi:hypothetical protein